jgi:hypothetical protein
MLDKNKKLDCYGINGGVSKQVTCTDQRYVNCFFDITFLANVYNKSRDVDKLKVLLINKILLLRIF